MKALKIAAACIATIVCVAGAYLWGYMSYDGIPMTEVKWQKCANGGGCKLVTEETWQKLNRAAAEPTSCGTRT